MGISGDPFLWQILMQWVGLFIGLIHLIKILIAVDNDIYSVDKIVIK